MEYLFLSIPQKATWGTERHDAEITAQINQRAADGWRVVTITRGQVIGPVSVLLTKDQTG